MMKMADKRYSNITGIPYSLPIPYQFIYPPYPPNNHFSPGNPDIQIHLSPITSPPPNRMTTPFAPFYPPPNSLHNKNEPSFRKRENKPIQIIDPNTKKEINYVKETPFTSEISKESIVDQETPKHEGFKIKQEFFQRIASAASHMEQISPETKIKDEFKNKVEEALISDVNGEISNPDISSIEDVPINNISGPEIDSSLEKLDYSSSTVDPNPVHTMIFSNSRSELENNENLVNVASENCVLSTPPSDPLNFTQTEVYSRDIILKLRESYFSNPTLKKNHLDSSKIFCFAYPDLFYYSPNNIQVNFQSAAVFIPKPRDKVNLIEKLTWILNLITPENYEKLSKKAIDLVSTAQTKDHLESFIHCIFKKSINEPTYCEFYARLCNDMAKIFICDENIPTKDSLNLESKHVTFRRCLLTICQQEFEKDKDENESLIRMKLKIEECKDMNKSILEDEYVLKEKQVHKHSLGNVRLIGELYRLNMLSENIIHECTVRLLKGRPTDDYLEALCRLFTVVGKDLDKPEAKDRIDQYFERIQHLMKRGFMSTRVKYLLMNLIDLRLDGWVERRENEKPKTLDELHQHVSRKSGSISSNQQRISSTFHSPMHSLPDSESTQPILPKFSSSNLPSLKNINSQRLFRPTLNWSSNEKESITSSLESENATVRQDLIVSKVEIAPSEVIKSSISILKEYEHLRDMDEVVQYFENLYPLTIISTVICGFFYSLNVSGGKLRYSLIELMQKCFEQGLISNKNFVDGILKMLFMVENEDISEDCPLIFDFIIEVLVSLFSSQHLIIVSLLNQFTTEFEEFYSSFIGSLNKLDNKLLFSNIISADIYLSNEIISFVKLRFSELFNDINYSLIYSEISQFNSLQFEVFRNELKESVLPELYSKFKVTIYNKAHFLVQIILLQLDYPKFSNALILKEFDLVISEMPSLFHYSVLMNIFARFQECPNQTLSFEILQPIISILYSHNTFTIDELDEIIKNLKFDNEFLLKIKQLISIC